MLTKAFSFLKGNPQPKGPVVRKRIAFYGRVQGVGFRYRANHAASAVGATGWVRNEYDGSVTMEIQATEAEIDQVIQMIRRGRFVEIERMESKELPLREDEYGFREEY